MKIVNAFFRKVDEKLYTYTSNQDVNKHLDYILVDALIFRKVSDAEAGNLLDLGSDHKSMLCRCRNQPSKRHRKGKRRAATQTVPAWPPDDCKLYAKCLTECLDMKRERDLESRCDKIEQAIGTAMLLAKAAPDAALLDRGDGCQDPDVAG